MNKKVKKYNVLDQDLDHILEHTKALWEDLREKKMSPNFPEGDNDSI